MLQRGVGAFCSSDFHVCAIRQHRLLRPLEPGSESFWPVLDGVSRAWFFRAVFRL